MDVAKHFIFVFNRNIGIHVFPYRVLYMESVAKSVCLAFLYHHKETTINKLHDSDIFKADIFAYSHHISLIYLFSILVETPCELSYGVG